MIQETGATLTSNRTGVLSIGVVFTILGLVGFFTPLENSTTLKSMRYDETTVRGWIKSGA